MPLKAKVFSPTKFVGIIRNGFVVCEGIRRRRGHDIDLFARHWFIANKIMMEDSGLVDFMLVTYEDLIEDPQKVVNSIFDFIGVSRVALNEDKVMNRQNICGKFFSLNNSPSFNKLSLDALSDEDKKIIINEAGELLCKFGYVG